MKKFFTLMVILFTQQLYAQTECEEQFKSDEVLRWRKQLNFKPKYMTQDYTDNLISKLSDRAYFQMHIEISVSCKRPSEKESKMQNMYYFWDKKISENELNTYYPAYYVFYQLDKAALSNQ